MEARKFAAEASRNMPRPVVLPEKSPRQLGEILVERGHITNQQLRVALVQKYRSGAPLGEVLVESGVISDRALTSALGAQWNVKSVNLKMQGPEFEQLTHADPKACLQVGAVPWRLRNRIPVIAVSDPERINEAKAACGLEDRPVEFVLASRSQIAATIERFFGAELERDACLTCPETLSARNWNLGRTAGIGVLVILAVLAGLAFAPLALFWFVFLSVLVTNIATAIFRLVLTAARFWPKNRSAKIQASDMARLGPRLPRVTVMIGLLNEELVIPKLMQSLSAIDYPPELLEILLLLEEGDEVTPRALAATDPQSRRFRVITVPAGTLKTKPRALNYGLNFARGEIIGILDAEDRPGPDQIKAVVAALKSAPPDVACVQGVIDFYNVRRNWLSRCFAIEYATWFRVLLRGMHRLRLPIPLGGTTVYFRRSVLERIGAWDAHNVTEDADLGMRLARFGYRTEVISEATMEEANAQALPWIKQRSRWIKGYMVTWATHMARPVELYRDLGLSGFVTFQLLLLGGVVSYLSIPFFWILWIGVFGFDLVGDLGGLDLVWKLAFGSMIFGQLVMILVAATALYGANKRSLLPWIVTLPIYWPLGAAAGYKALFELFFAPYYWDKTAHGHQSDDT